MTTTNGAFFPHPSPALAGESEHAGCFEAFWRNITSFQLQSRKQPAGFALYLWERGRGEGKSFAITSC